MCVRMGSQGRRVHPTRAARTEPDAGIFEVDSLARSGDHKWAVFAADRFYLYSSDSDSLTTVPLTTVNPPQDEFGVRGYAINADGTKIAVASATQVTFLDHSLTAIATAPIPGAFQTSSPSSSRASHSKFFRPE